MTISRPAMRYDGGKFRLAPWVMRFFPPHRINPTCRAALASAAGGLFAEAA
ncbi:MAG: hypothetical protein U1C04_18690 [Hydrogenophaga sp.]|uniref:hypothetical protein n=1 Tax=Hydrogenophaga sp. TaxID=1904254 RepID=UPI002ABD025E|nr:hypothetical protein [Hydrogenophaga sp.]MDZ4282778.1 hypothetical protein [Hydrogenophaga sp.]